MEVFTARSTAIGVATGVLVATSCGLAALASGPPRRPPRQASARLLRWRSAPGRVPRRPSAWVRAAMAGRWRPARNGPHRRRRLSGERPSPAPPVTTTPQCMWSATPSTTGSAGRAQPAAGVRGGRSLPLASPMCYTLGKLAPDAYKVRSQLTRRILTCGSVSDSMLPRRLPQLLGSGGSMELLGSDPPRSIPVPPLSRSGLPRLPMFRGSTWSWSCGIVVAPAAVVVVCRGPADVLVSWTRGRSGLVGTLTLSDLAPHHLEPEGQSAMPVTARPRSDSRNSGGNPQSRATNELTPTQVF